MKSLVKLALLEQTTFITGFAKNAGKTTFLNYAANVVRESGPCALLSIGVDGESKDAVFNNPKPQIKVRKGDVFVSARKLVNSSFFEIINVFSSNTVLGRLALYRALREEYVELSGPQSNAALGEIISFINSSPLLPKTVLADGAINRITQVSSLPDAGFVYVMKVNPQNEIQVADKIKLLLAFEDKALYKQPPQNAYYEAGAFTETKANAVAENVNAVVIDDITKVFLNFNQWRVLTKKRQIYFKNRLPLKFIVLTAENLAADVFKAKFTPKEQEKLVVNPYAFN